mmetsp:Transcript_21997/g.61175  ORF Transcript_21997/g.61175 Transcript_21997/m.61175 type:complete len:421 (+) Transcript_21997:1811-3073(+)
MVLYLFPVHGRCTLGCFGGKGDFVRSVHLEFSLALFQQVLLEGLEFLADDGTQLRVHRPKVLLGLSLANDQGNNLFSDLVVIDECGLVHELLRQPVHGRPGNFVQDQEALVRQDVRAEIVLGFFVAGQCQARRRLGHGLGFPPGFLIDHQGFALFERRSSFFVFRFGVGVLRHVSKFHNLHRTLVDEFGAVLVGPLAFGVRLEGFRGRCVDVFGPRHHQDLRRDPLYRLLRWGATDAGGVEELNVLDDDPLVIRPVVASLSAVVFVVVIVVVPATPPSTAAASAIVVVVVVVVLVPTPVLHVLHILHLRLGSASRFGVPRPPGQESVIGKGPLQKGSHPVEFAAANSRDGNDGEFRLWGLSIRDCVVVVVVVVVVTVDDSHSLAALWRVHQIAPGELVKVAPELVGPDRHQVLQNDARGR